MGNENNLPDEEKFSDDPEENLRMQNDFLKLKMMAQSGAIFGGDGTLPPEIENEFLKNVLEFESMNAIPNSQTIGNILGNPLFEIQKNYDDQKLEKEFDRLTKLLEEHSINVDFIAPQTNRFKYDFITKELFNHETFFVPVKGMITNFLYEEFHPDHVSDIKEITHRFLNDFLEKKLDDDSDYLAEEIIEPDGKIVTREEMIKRFHSLYEVADDIINFSFQIDNVNFELKEEQKPPTGMGFSEGEIHYDLVFRNGEIKSINGPFKIYFGMEWGCWNVYFFYLAGFNLHKK
ncbi:MAG: hypothetical protein ABIP35_03985 [Ginsengibacter sp.]